MRHPLGLLFLAALFIPLVGCSEPTPTGPEPVEEPWTRQFIFGNSFINTVVIVTNQDGVSADYLTDYVTEAALPNVDLEVFTTHIYLPVADGMMTRVTDASIIASRTDGSRTPDFLGEAEYVQRSVIGGEAYDVYRLEGIYVGTPALRPSTFANVVFGLTASYTEPSGGVIYSSTKTVEIYKR